MQLFTLDRNLKPLMETFDPSNVEGVLKLSLSSSDCEFGNNEIAKQVIEQVLISLDQTHQGSNQIETA